jgi:hypothetical protein
MTKTSFVECLRKLKYKETNKNQVFQLFFFICPELLDGVCAMLPHNAGVGLLNNIFVIVVVPNVCKVNERKKVLFQKKQV